MARTRRSGRILASVARLPLERSHTPYAHLTHPSHAPHTHPLRPPADLRSACSAADRELATRALPANRRIFLHMTVNLPTSGASYLRVGAGEARVFEAAGQRLLFDDSFEHEVWNEGGEPRHVLGIELIHPGERAPLKSEL